MRLCFQCQEVKKGYEVNKKVYLCDKCYEDYLRSEIRYNTGSLVERIHPVCYTKQTKTPSPSHH